MNTLKIFESMLMDAIDAQQSETWAHDNLVSSKPKKVRSKADQDSLERSAIRQSGIGEGLQKALELLGTTEKFVEAAERIENNE